MGGERNKIVSRDEMHWLLKELAAVENAAEETPTMANLAKRKMETLISLRKFKQTGVLSESSSSATTINRANISDFIRGLKNVKNADGGKIRNLLQLTDNQRGRTILRKAEDVDLRFLRDADPRLPERLLEKTLRTLRQPDAPNWWFSGDNNLKEDDDVSEVRCGSFVQNFLDKSGIGQDVRESFRRRGPGFATVVGADALKEDLPKLLTEAICKWMPNRPDDINQEDLEDKLSYALWRLGGGI